MDYEARISRVEAQLEMNQKDIERLYEAISELRLLMQERFDQVDLRFSEERKYMDLRFSEERKYIDQHFSEERKQTELGISGLQAQLNELRHEVGVNMRWMMGMWLTTIGMVAGIGGRVFGFY